MFIYFLKNESFDQNSLPDHELHAQAYMNLINLNFQFIFALVLINFRESPSDDLSSDRLPKLNSYFHSLQEQLELNDMDQLYRIDSILDDYLSLTVRYLSVIESDAWSSVKLADSFTWLSDTFLRKLIQMSAQVDAKEKRLCSHFVNIFRSFTLLFAIDYELIKSKVFFSFYFKIITFFF